MMMFATALESSIPEITGRIVDELFAAERDQQTALIYALALFGVIVLSSIFAMTSTAASSWVSNKVIMDLRVDMFCQIIKTTQVLF